MDEDSGEDRVLLVSPKRSDSLRSHLVVTVKGKTPTCPVRQADSSLRYERHLLLLHLLLLERAGRTGPCAAKVLLARVPSNPNPAPVEPLLQ